MKIAIIGGAGNMGRWLCRFEIEEGVEVIVADKSAENLKKLPGSDLIEKTTDSAEAATKARFIIISVPIDRFEEAVKEIAPHVQPGSIVMDLSSVKARPVALMHQYFPGCTVVGAHPLFGHNVTRLQDQNIVFTPAGEKDMGFALALKRFFEERGAHVKIMDAEAHDKMMAVVQGLSHFTAIAAADALAGLGDLKDMKEISTTTFRIFLNYIESVIGDDPELYAAIQMEHPEMKDIYQRLTEGVEKFARWVENKDAKAFVNRMRELKGFLGK